jgi:hypothetical protein
MKKSVVLALVIGVAIGFAGSVALAKCGKGVTIRNDNASDITITQISYSLAGAGNYTAWPNKQGAPGVPFLLAAGASWVPVLSNLATVCKQPIDVKVDYTIAGVATYEVDQITDVQRLVTLHK